MLLLLLGCPIKSYTYPPPPATDLPTEHTGDTDPIIDLDGDGFEPPEDCDDTNPHIYPGAPEACDGIDSDCDGPDPGEQDLNHDGALDCEACAARGWFAATNDAHGAALEDILRGMMLQQSCDSYDDARLFLFNTLSPVDGVIYGVYTGATATPDGTASPDGFNTEHSWPQSMGANENPRRCDLHHLYPVESSVNSRRNNHPYGVVADPSWTGGGSRFGVDTDGVTVFEPRDVHKGNAARSMLYFSIQYGYAIDPDKKELYKAWSALDPVDEAEIARTLAIEAEQGAPNALVLCPFLIEDL